VRALVWEHQAADEAAAAALASALGLEPVVARVLALRGLADPDEAARFLTPSLDQLHDPYRLADLGRAVERLFAALASREKIAIHGDYDVDGVTSTVILRRALEMAGASVIHFIPHRMRDGYGLQPAAVDRLHADGVGLIVSVDCGIRGVDAARRARELGVDLIVTDHHEPEAELPPAYAVINPKRADCQYPDKNLAGVGVALKLVQAICARLGRERWLPAFVKMAAIGTLADVVPLLGENRVIAKIGLAALSRGPNAVGLRALIEAAGLTGKRLDSYHVSYLLAPRVNAAGRMASPDIAARLLLATDESLAGEASGLAAQLNDENLRRQQEEAEIVGQARKAIETDPTIGAHNLLIVAGDGWHRGVIGIVASKIVDAFHKPTIVLSVEGGLAHGSCRSIPGFDMLGALERAADVFVRFGGHRQAAGLTIETARIPELRARLTAFADEVLEPDQLVPRLRVDGPLPLRAITPGVVSGRAALEPFGAANPRPIFHASPVELVDAPRTIKDRHLALSVRQQGRVFRAIAWRAAERAAFLAEHRAALDLAFSLEENQYRGETYIQLTVADIRPS
jgi:single-stranded-DNA-specific exonuclease